MHSGADLAFVVDDGVPAPDVEATAAEAAGEMLVSLTLFDVYRDTRLGAGRRSLAWRLRLQATDHTLTDAAVRSRAIAAVRSRAIAAVEERHGAVRRG
ncbi:MAG: hypothetical protein ACRD1K_16725 [Acidimicrobiales bacterium]